MLLPSLRISGGVKEALKFAEELSSSGNPVQLVALWKNKYELTSTLPIHYLSDFVAQRSLAAVQFPLLLLRFFLFLRSGQSSNSRRPALVLTHFSTFPFAWIASMHDWNCFNQDVEWMFVKEGFRRVLLRWFILATSRRSRVVTTNAFVEGLYLREGLKPFGRLSIWPSPIWLTGHSDAARDIDVVMLLRRGHMKRLDLYIDILRRMKQRDITSCIVTPDSDIFDEVATLSTTALLRPSDQELRVIYQRAQIFLLLSDTEGFSLPPLEAMGSGCVPICRDSGGPRSYMVGLLSENLIPLEASNAHVLETVQTLLSDTKRLGMLSEYAVEKFAEGSVIARTERSECIAALTDALHKEA
jgi:glycosyltransferase involved in cell wall biosynthesis